MKLLGEHEDDLFDAFANESFHMHAMLFCTKNNFPTYGKLSTYNVKGHRACPNYEENTLVKTWQENSLSSTS